MKKETSQWSKDVRKAVIDKDMTLKQLAENIGYSFTTVSAVINGRYSNASYQEIAEKINKVLGTKGLPKRINTPSDEWCASVAAGLKLKHMNVTQLSEKLNVSRDRISSIVNGKLMDEKIVNDINKLLNIEIPAVPSGDD
ncbi:MAG: helix-turn-helix transcriptional regulator [Lachnospiraceae bacterium]|nr:helix-turn-helix transcriptional regulator [Lachnospiraceae bacterium]